MSSSSTSSPSSQEFDSRSPHSAISHLSQSTVTLAPSPGGYSQSQKSKFEEAHKDIESQYPTDAAPPYYPTYPPTHPDISLPIDPLRDSNSLTEGGKASLLSNLDESDAFTISTFSYYGQPSSPTSPISPISTMPPSSPTVVPQSLPPPPRRFPRQSPSSLSVRTTTSNMSSPVCPPQTHTSDVHSNSPSQPSLGLEALPERQDPSSRTLGVPGGSILVTIQRQASLDRGM